MADFKSYKGDDGNWKKEFVKSGTNNQYNEGNVITTLGSPIWSTERRGFVPVTDKHDPCGVWNRQYIPNPFEPEKSIAAAPGIRYICWSPFYGNPGIGRFVAADDWYSQLYYTDDGGNFWQAMDMSWLPAGANIIGQSLDYSYNYGSEGQFHLGFQRSGAEGFYCASAISEDGLDWTIGPNLDVSSRLFNEILWSPAANKFFCVTYTGGARSHLYLSDDCLTWTHRAALGLFTLYFLAYWRGVCFLVGSNYNSPYVSTDNLITFPQPTLGDPWYPYEFNIGPPIVERQQLKGGEDYLYYSMCYADGTGYFKEFPDYRFIRMDYCPLNRWFASYDRIQSPNHLILYRSEYGWNDVGIATNPPWDVAVGYDRAIFAEINSIDIVTGLNVGG